MCDKRDAVGRGLQLRDSCVHDTCCTCAAFALNNTAALQPYVLIGSGPPPTCCEYIVTMPMDSVLGVSPPFFCPLMAWLCLTIICLTILATTCSCTHRQEQVHEAVQSSHLIHESPAEVSPAGQNDDVSHHVSTILLRMVHIEMK